MSDNNKEEPFLLSPYQMAEIKRLTKELQAVTDRVRQRNNLFNMIMHAFKNPYPIEETHEKVYHVSGFKPFAMFDILFGKGLKWRKRHGIYYNTTEYAISGNKRYHISDLHALGMYFTKLESIHWVGLFFFNIPSFGYLRRFGLLPFNVTYEIDVLNGFNKDAEVYIDNAYETPAIDDNGEEFSIYRYVVQSCIPSQYIRLKAITLALPMFGYTKVIWRRK